MSTQGPTIEDTTTSQLTSSPPDVPSDSEPEKVEVKRQSTLPEIQAQYTRIKRDGKGDLLVYPNSHIMVEGEGAVRLCDFLKQMLAECSCVNSSDSLDQADIAKQIAEEAQQLVEDLKRMKEKAQGDGKYTTLKGKEVDIDTPLPDFIDDMIEEGLEQARDEVMKHTGDGKEEEILEELEEGLVDGMEKVGLVKRFRAKEEKTNEKISTGKDVVRNHPGIKQFIDLHSKFIGDFKDVGNWLKPVPEPNTIVIDNKGQHRAQSKK